MTYNPDTHNRKSIRLKNYDYSKEGLYFITICTKNNKRIFGEIGATLCGNVINLRKVHNYVLSLKTF